MHSPESLSTFLNKTGRTGSQRRERKKKTKTKNQTRNRPSKGLRRPNFSRTLPEGSENDAFDAEEFSDGLYGHEFLFRRHVEQNQAIKSVYLTNL